MVTRLPKKQALTLTEMAANRLRELMSAKIDAQKELYGIKVGVRRRGCNGYSYVMNYCQDESEVDKLDEVVEEKDVRVIVD